MTRTKKAKRARKAVEEPSTHAGKKPQGVKKNVSKPSNTKHTVESLKKLTIDQAKEIGIDEISIPGFRSMVQDRQRECPGLSVVQILFNICHAKGAYSIRARKFLRARQIEVPNLDATSASKMECLSREGSIWDHLPRDRRAPMVTAILRKTRGSRTALTTADIAEWAKKAKSKIAKSTSVNSRRVRSKVVERVEQYLTYLVNQARQEDPASACEDILVRKMNSPDHGHRKAFTFLYDVVRGRPDMVIEDSTLRKWAQEPAVKEAKLAAAGTREDEAMPSESEYEPVYDERYYDGDAESVVDLTKDDSQDSDADEPDVRMQKPTTEEADLDSRTASWPSKEKTIRSMLHYLSPTSQVRQLRYFGSRHPDDLVVCFTCGQNGHSSEDCMTGECSFCGGAHSGAHCAQTHKCGWCRRRGHSEDTCKAAPVRPGLPDDPCDVCGRFDHAEQECGRLWCTFDLSQANKIPAEDMIVYCYNCGGRHWGDDCPTLPASVASRRVLCNTFSAANAANFILKEDTVERATEQHSGSVAAYQLAMLDDY